MIKKETIFLCIAIPLIIIPNIFMYIYVSKYNNKLDISAKLKCNEYGYNNVTNIHKFSEKGMSIIKIYLECEGTPILNKNRPEGYFTAQQIENVNCTEKDKWQRCVEYDNDYILRLN